MADRESMLEVVKQNKAPELMTNRDYMREIVKQNAHALQRAASESQAKTDSATGPA